VVAAILASIPIVARAFPGAPNVASPVRKLIAALTLMRLLSYVILAVISTFLLRDRNSIWVERLRIAIGAVLLLVGITLVLDKIYFPSTFFLNLMRWLVLVAWLIYFFVSVRVRMVFFSKTWGEMPIQEILS